MQARDARTGLAIFTGLYGRWQTRAGFSEGLRCFDILIALDGPKSDIRALALCWSGTGERPRSREFAEEVLRL